VDLAPTGVILSSLQLIGVVVLGRVSIADRPCQPLHQVLGK
jgi:hypothetical protein